MASFDRLPGHSIYVPVSEVREFHWRPFNEEDTSFERRLIDSSAEGVVPQIMALIHDDSDDVMVLTKSETDRVVLPEVQTKFAHERSEAAMPQYLQTRFERRQGLVLGEIEPIPFSETFDSAPEDGSKVRLWAIRAKLLGPRPQTTNTDFHIGYLPIEQLAERADKQAKKSGKLMDDILSDLLDVAYPT